MQLGSGVRDLADLPAGEVRLFHLSPAALPMGAEDVVLPALTAAERARHERFRFERHRREHLATRALVRAVLSLYCARDEWRFEAGPFGRPEVVPPCGLTFNLANHPSLVVCAVALAGRTELGVDVEPFASADSILEVADTHFAAPEREGLAALDADAKRDRALSLWTAKEAYLKARGAGLSLPLDAFAVRFGEEPTIDFLQPIDDGGAFTIRLLDLEGHRVAIAARGLGAPMRVVVERADAIVARQLDQS
ncbi:MAG TPA: 4'-phosphopantetheinyl transferase superfamily protein [Labilithrix sp.]|jgi:4'-phosphopantetheinyl transferase